MKGHAQLMGRFLTCLASESTNKSKSTTYAIRAEDNSGVFSVNGAAARLACPGDLIIVCAYALFDAQTADQHKPVLVYFNEKNQVVRSASSIPVQPA